MGTKPSRPFKQQILSEGNPNDRKLSSEEISREAKELVSRMPVGWERVTYVRNLAQQVKMQKLDMDVFRAFVYMTNSWEELQTLLDG